ncbi:trypsin-like peptidase domain-containing protein [Candidatus Pacearchaeota archaeon]|nr:trypsin-like peptidase domain-containing protein [Candidatus Pacearchaeota archaeon]
MDQKILHEKHQRHRNVLYFLVIILLVLQTVSFISLSGQITKLSNQQEIQRNANNKAIENISQYFSDTIYENNALNQQSINELALALSKQESSLTKEISLLKSSSGDFSGIIEDVVKGVVSVGTDKAMGSGFVITQDGYIVTNQHVIAGAKKIAILTYDKQVVSAKLIGYDLNRDIALLKADGSYNALEFGNSDNVQPGRKVIAIGNPLGLSFTVTQGIVSAINREGPNGLEEYIQTDVSLNPGNSGGPLIDVGGQVIGVNNFKVGGAESLGFALEINVAKDVVNKIANATIVN